VPLSRTSVEKLLWAKAAGRCEYEGCPEILWRDALTKKKYNRSYVAHIIAEQPNGPRGDPVLSEQLKNDIDNLMLLCDAHHRLVDRIDIDEHTVTRLREMKKHHEQRMELLTSMPEGRKTHIVLYGANIGEISAPLNWHLAAQALIPHRYPAEGSAIELGLINSALEDHEDDYWQMERRNLRSLFEAKIRSRLVSRGDLEHLSVFGLAPIPLLVELGRLFSDIPAAEIYQLHREPPDWVWQKTPEGFCYVKREPNDIHDVVALKLSLSATIVDARIHEALRTSGVSTWEITIDKPNNDFLKGAEQLTLFRQQFRLLLDRAKAVHGQDAVLHVFPAVPVSVAVEIGRTWMPKADMTLCVYDQNRKRGGFVETLRFP